MKKIILFLFVLLFVTGNLFAGEDDTYFSLSSGLLYKKALSVEFTFEKELAYHNSWELGLDYYNQCLGQYAIDSTGYLIKKHAFLAQGAYNQVLVQYKNSNISLHLAGGLGANNELKFSFSAMPGIEYNYTFANGFKFFILQKNQFSFLNVGNTWFRTGLLIGIKIPL